MKHHWLIQSNKSQSRKEKEQKWLYCVHHVKCTLHICFTICANHQMQAALVVSYRLNNLNCTSDLFSPNWAQLLLTSPRTCCRNSPSGCIIAAAYFSCNPSILSATVTTPKQTHSWLIERNERWTRRRISDASRLFNVHRAGMMNQTCTITTGWHEAEDCKQVDELSLGYAAICQLKFPTATLPGAIQWKHVLSKTTSHFTN